MNNWYIIAQIFGVITITLEIVTYQIKDKKKFFLVSTTSSFFWLLMFISIGLATSMNTQLSLILAGVYSTVRNGLFYWMFKKDTPQTKELGLRILLLFISGVLIVGVFTVLSATPHIRWLHIAGVVAAVIFAVTQYLPGVHYVRGGVVLVAVLVGLTQTPLNILEGDIRWNIMGIAIESAKIISTIIFYIRYAIQPKKPQLQFSKPLETKQTTV